VKIRDFAPGMDQGMEARYQKLQALLSASA
jgi:hypothetical protein